MSSASNRAAELTRSIHERMEQLAAMVDEQQASEEMKRHLDFMAKFHAYSWGNCWLIAMQRPQASMVAGYTQWKRLGRQVREGEKAIRIIAPCPIRRKEKDTEKDDDEADRLFFKNACVFDVSQTEGKDLATFEVPDVQANAEELLTKLQRVAANRGISVRFATLPDGSYGKSTGGKIEVATGYSTGQQAKSLAHEIAHELIHWNKDGEIDSTVNRNIRELEAEAVAYVVCKHFGLDVDLRASRYIALWGGDAKALAASFSRISETARALIEDVTNLESNDPATESVEMAAAA